MEEKDLTDAELKEITRRKKEDINLGRWGPEKVRDVVGRVLSEEKENYEKWKREREKSRQFSKRRKPREVARRRVSRGKPGKGKYDGPKSGYTKFPNDFLEALYKHIGDDESRVLLFLVRKTWGWNKRSDFISLNQVVKELGILKPHVCRALSSLRKRRIVEQLRNKTYAIQADTSLWRDKPKKKKKE